MNETLSPEQTTKYYKEQTNLVNPLSPKDWLKTQNTISGTSLGVTPMPVIPKPQETIVDTQSIVSSLQPAPTTSTNTALTDATGRSKAYLDRIQGLYSQKSTIPTFQVEQETALGIPQQQRDIQELSNQLGMLQSEATAIPLQVSQESLGRGRTKAGVAPIVSARNRENAIQALTVSAQLQAKQGNLALAMSQVDRATKLKYDALAEQIANEERNLAILEKYELAPLQQQALEERKLANEAKKDELALKQEAESDFNKRLITAQNSGLTNLETQQARDLFNAGRIDEANQIIAQYSPTAIKARTTGVTSGVMGGYVFGENPAVDSWVSQIQSGRATIANVPANLKNSVVAALSSATPKQDLLQKEQITDTISEITKLKTARGLSKAVGPTFLGRFTPLKIDVMSGDVADFIASTEKIVSQLSLDSLVNAKSRGATFGALTGPELQLLASSASKIGTWRKLDDEGNVVGYATSEKAMKDELDNIAKYAKIDYDRKFGGASQFQDDETSLLDQEFGITTSTEKVSFDVDNFFE